MYNGVSCNQAVYRHHLEDVTGLPHIPKLDVLFNGRTRKDLEDLSSSLEEDIKILCFKM